MVVMQVSDSGAGLCHEAIQRTKTQIALYVPSS